MLLADPVPASPAATPTPRALLPLQLLWLNLMTDGLLGLSMGVEPAERGMMRRPPTAPGRELWAGGLGRQTLWVGLLIGAAIARCRLRLRADAIASSGRR